MNQIQITKNDFPNIEQWRGDYRIALFNESEDSMCSQYLQQPCVIARALIRQGYKEPLVSPWSATFDNERIEIGGGIEEVHRCANELLNGADEAFIKVNS